MLGHRHASGGDNESRGGRDVERIGPITSGPHDLERVHVVEQTHTVGPHPGGTGSDLVDGLSLDGQSGQKGGHLDLAGLAAHDLIHDGGGGIIGKVLPGGKLYNGFSDHGIIPPKNFLK